MAKDLALVLQTGALPVNFITLERTDVSATLGTCLLSLLLRTSSPPLPFNVNHAANTGSLLALPRAWAEAGQPNGEKVPVLGGFEGDHLGQAFEAVLGAHVAGLERRRRQRVRRCDRDEAAGELVARVVRGRVLGRVLEGPDHRVPRRVGDGGVDGDGPVDAADGRIVPAQNPNLLSTDHR